MQQAWKSLIHVLDSYAASHSTSDRLRLKRRESVYVLVVRPAVLAALGWLLYQWPPIWVTVPIEMLISYLLIDAILVSTAHAFGESAPRGSLRFVVLNLCTFFSLTLWFAAAFAPLAKNFDPHLDYLNALELAFAAVTASATASAPQAMDWAGSLATGLATTIALYFLIVVIVMAVTPASPLHP